jgi:hypothetical protein
MFKLFVYKEAIVVDVEERSSRREIYMNGVVAGRWE